jgi:pentatricopeptide repeat protein
MNESPDPCKKKSSQEQDHQAAYCSSRRPPDNGQPFMGPNFTAPDRAPRPLDHFKRGYGERMESREREATGFTNDPKSWQPPPAGTMSVGDADPIPGNQGQSCYYRPAMADTTGTHKRQPYHNGWNYVNRINSGSGRGGGEINKHDDKQHTRSTDGYSDKRRQRNNYFLHDNNSNFVGHNSLINNHSSNHHGGAGGFSMEEFVDRLCHPHTASVYTELNHARSTSPESFVSGRAITAILSQLGRRRQMRVAYQVWSWMDKTVPRIKKNIFHYNALINVCEKSKDWKGALDLLHQMDNNFVEKNEITYSSAISACEKGGNWRVALDLLSTMKEQRITPTAIAYNAGKRKFASFVEWLKKTSYLLSIAPFVFIFLFLHYKPSLPARRYASYTFNVFVLLFPFWHLTLLLVLSPYFIRD